MPLHILIAIAGPTAGFLLSAILYLGKRNLDEMTDTLTKAAQQTEQRGNGLHL